MPDDRISAVALRTQGNLGMLGKSLRKVFPVEQGPRFAELLSAIDEADREHWREEDRLEALRRLRT